MKHHRVKPDHRVDLDDHDAGDTGDHKSEVEAAECTEELRQKLETLQERLYAEGSRAVLVVLQGSTQPVKMGRSGTS